MTTLASLVVKLGLDDSELQGGLGRAADSADKFGGKMKDVGGKMTVAGAKATAGITLPILAAGKAVFDAASDTAESMSKVDVVFAESAGVIHQWAESAAQDLGISTQQAEEAAGTFGNLFRAIGITTPKAADMSKGMVKLASDLASFNNANPEDVLLALRSGLLGEAEPMRQFGVSLSAARIEAEGFASGLVKPVRNMGEVTAAAMAVAKANDAASTAAAKHGYESLKAQEARLKATQAEAKYTQALQGQAPEMDAAQKAQAAYSIIMKDTALAQGDFARTADGAANKQRILAAQFKDAAATLGTQLLPIGQQFLGWVSGLIEKFSNLSPETQKMIMIGAGLLAVIGPLVTVVGALVTAIGFLVSPVGLVVVAIAALIFIGYQLYKHWDEVRAFASDVWSSISAAVGRGVDAVVSWFQGLPERIGSILTRIPGVLGTMLGHLIVFLVTLPHTMAELTVNLGIALINGIIRGAGVALPFLWNLFLKLPGIIWELLGNGAETLVHVGKNLIIGLWNGLNSMRSWIWQKVQEFFKGMLGPIGKALGLGSPSRITAQYGRWLVEGMAGGMLSGEGMLHGVADRIANAALPDMGALTAGVSDPTSGAGVAGAMAGVGGSSAEVVLEVDGYRLGKVLVPGVRAGLADVERRNVSTSTT